MKTPEQTIQEAIWLLIDINHEISVGNEVPNTQEIVKAVAPHLLRSLRVALRMVQLDPKSALSHSNGCGWEVGLAQSLLPVTIYQDDPEPLVQDEEPEE